MMPEDYGRVDFTNVPGYETTSEKRNIARLIKETIKMHRELQKIEIKALAEDRNPEEAIDEYLKAYNRKHPHHRWTQTRGSKKLGKL